MNIRSKNCISKILATGILVALITMSETFLPANAQDDKWVDNPPHNSKYPANGTGSPPSQSSAGSKGNSTSPTNVDVAPRPNFTNPVVPSAPKSQETNPTTSAGNSQSESPPSATGSSQPTSSHPSEGNTSEGGQGLAENNNQGLKPEVVMGIVVGSTLGGVVLILGILFLCRRYLSPRFKKKKEKQPERGESPASSSG